MYNVYGIEFDFVVNARAKNLTLLWILVYKHLEIYMLVDAHFGASRQVEAHYALYIIHRSQNKNGNYEGHLSLWFKLIIW